MALPPLRQCQQGKWRLLCDTYMFPCMFGVPHSILSATVKAVKKSEKGGGVKSGFSRYFAIVQKGLTLCVLEPG